MRVYHYIRIIALGVNALASLSHAVEQDHSERAEGLVVIQAPDYTELFNTGVADEVLIAVMGATGSGKTTFVNTASNSTLQVGSGLHSCTSKVQVTKPFHVDGRWVTLIDTPGFDDTTMSDTEILSTIAAFLSETYRQGMKMAGIVYVHRITDRRMGGISMRSFKTFRELCGEQTLKNVILMTNMWGEVSLEVGEAREAELASKDMFFKAVLNKGAQLVRYNNTFQGSRDVIGRIVQNHPLPLRIQEELVDEGKDIHDTGAGAALSQELNEQAKKYREEMRKLQEDMETALEKKDEETQRELEEQAQILRAEMKRVQDEAEGLTSAYNAEKVKLEEQMKEMAETTRKENERLANEHNARMEALGNELRGMREANEQEKAELRRQIDALSTYDGHGGFGGPFGLLGGFLDMIFMGG